MALRVLEALHPIPRLASVAVGSQDIHDAPVDTAAAPRHQNEHTGGRPSRNERRPPGLMKGNLTRIAQNRSTGRTESAEPRVADIKGPEGPVPVGGPKKRPQST